MSWDLSHIRRLEGAMTESEYNKADFEMHSLATFDNGLKEMLSIYPIKTIAFSKNKKIMIFVNDFKNFIEEIDVSVYWLKRSPESRRIIFEKTDWDQFIRSKESELLKLMN